MTRSTAALLSLFVSLAVPAGAIAEPQWRMVRSPNFVVLGDAGEKPLQDVAMRLEQFRTALGRVLPGVELATPVPTVLVVFESSKSYEAFGPRREGRPVQAAGFFLAGPDVNYITLTLDSGHDGLRVAFHEYSHLILHNWMASVPAWLDEGLAEYYSTFQLATNGRSATIGLAIPHHAGLLRERFMPLSDLLAVDRQSSVYNEGDQRTLFYAGSWALTHYLLMETPKGDAKIARYLALVAGGETVDRAVQQAFEMPPAALERLLVDYVNRGAYRSAEYTFRSRVEAGQGNVRALSAAETEGWLGDLLLHLNRPDEAGPRLTRALELDPDLARAHLSVGMLNLGQQRPDEAWPHLRRAVALDPANFFAQYLVRAGAAVVSYRGNTAPDGRRAGEHGASGVDQGDRVEPAVHRRALIARLCGPARRHPPRRGESGADACGEAGARTAGVRAAVGRDLRQAEGLRQGAEPAHHPGRQFGRARHERPGAVDARDAGRVARTPISAFGRAAVYKLSGRLS